MKRTLAFALGAMMLKTGAAFGKHTPSLPQPDETGYESFETEALRTLAVDAKASTLDSVGLATALLESNYKIIEIAERTMPIIRSGIQGPIPDSVYKESMEPASWEDMPDLPSWAPDSVIAERMKTKKKITRARAELIQAALFTFEESTGITQTSNPQLWAVADTMATINEEGERLLMLVALFEQTLGAAKIKDLSADELHRAAYTLFPRERRGLRCYQDMKGWLKDRPAEAEVRAYLGLR